MKNQEIVRWIQDGAKFEDAGSLVLGTARFLNHFHNPLRDLPEWPTAGLNGTLTGTSAPLWAQDASANPTWSWPEIRRSYYQALTQPQKATREAWFAQVFAGLGHVVHLVQDMSQPGHVRNDGHPVDAVCGSCLNLLWGGQMETWAEQNPGTINTFAAADPVFPTLPLTRVGTVGGQAIGPISELWDTDRYQGDPTGFPFWGADDGRTLGLAEYTNGSYFSADTINSSNPGHQFPRPPAHIGYYSVCRDDPPATAVWGAARWYISRYPCPTDPEQRPDHFLAHTLLGTVLRTQPDTIMPAMRLDDRVMEDYARDLIPRAVGYSAALINYFFRGQLHIEPVSPNQVIVRNLSDEPLTDGTIDLYAEDVSGNRVHVASVAVSSPIERDQASAPTLLTPPVDIQTGYWAVFQGTLGAEQNAVIGSFTDMLWVEEWDLGLTGRHPWWVKALDPNYPPVIPGGSFQPTTAQDGILTMTNFRPAGTYTYSVGQENRVSIGTSGDPYWAPYNDSFPRAVSPNTAIHLKVNAMSVSRESPEGCTLVQEQGIYTDWSPTGYNWQVIEFSFTSGGAPYKVWFTTPANTGAGWGTGSGSIAYVYLTMGADMGFNIYQLFQSLGFPIVEPFQVESIAVRQVLICPRPDYVFSPSEDQQQVLEMDAIRVLEAGGP